MVFCDVLFGKSTPFDIGLISIQHSDCRILIQPGIQCLPKSFATWGCSVCCCIMADLVVFLISDVTGLIITIHQSVQH